MSAKAATATRNTPRRSTSPTRAAQRQTGRKGTQSATSASRGTPARGGTTSPARSAKAAPTKRNTPATAKKSRHVAGKSASTPPKQKPTVARKVTQAPASGGEVTTTYFVGFDLGTNTSCVQASGPRAKSPSVNAIIPTVVGYAEENILSGILPNNSETLFGGDAVRHRLHARNVHPMRDGVVDSVEAARDFCRYVRGLIDPTGKAELRAVIGIPASAPDRDRENLRHVVTGVFERVFLIPEPFLAALGYRDESRLGEEGYIDPVSNSLFVDIGAGTTDLSMVQGYFPTAEDEINCPIAGDRVDQWLYDLIRDTYPDTGVSIEKVREIKEEFSCVGEPGQGCIARIIVNGKVRNLDVGELVAEACNRLCEEVFSRIKQLLSRAPSDCIEEMLQNIVVTGGGSQIKGFAERLNQLLEAEGYYNPRVVTAGDRYKEYVALGGWKAAVNARSSQWQHLVT